MKTYKEVGESVGLSGGTLDIYVKYMKSRWEGTEDQKCKDGYASEWAMRFKSGREFLASDGEGKRVLSSLDKRYEEDYKRYFQETYSFLCEEY